MKKVTLVMLVFMFCVVGCGNFVVNEEEKVICDNCTNVDDDECICEMFNGYYLRCRCSDGALNDLPNQQQDKGET